jgi:hypothetical protein
MTLTALAFPFASQAGVKKLCFESSSSVSGDKSTQNYTYGEIRNGHVNLFGRVCYTPKIGVTECSPAMGSSILHNNVLEGNIQYAEFENYSGVENFTEQTIHVKLNLDTLKGTYVSSVSMFSEGQQTPREAFDKGLVTAVACPPTTKEQRALDDKFRNTIKNLDNLK